MLQLRGCIFQASADICGVVCKRDSEVAPCGVPGLEEVGDIEALLEPRLRRLSVYVFHDPILFTKLCRLFRVAIANSEAADTTPDYIKRCLVDLLGALALIPSNAAAACELWESLKLIAYTERYWIYAEVHWNVYQEHPELVLERARCRDEMRILLKSLTKENVGKKRRALGKLSNSNPLVVGDVVVDYVQEWESMIEVCKEALLYCSSLALDVLSYLFLEELGGALHIKKGFLQDDNANLERWLVNLSSFISDVYVKYPRTEMKGLLQHLFNRLRNDAFGELVLLRDLVSKMAGIRYEVESVSNEVLEARCGGERLRQQVENPWPAEFLFEQAKAEEAGKGGGAARIKAYYMGNKERKEASECLLEALQTSKLTMPILVTIAQQMADCAFTREAQDKSQIKYTSWLHRQAQETLLVYADFLWRRMPSMDYVSLLPKITDLVESYRLLPELGLLILRPAIRWRSESEALAPIVDLGSSVKEMLKGVEAKNPNLWKAMGTSLYAMFWSLSLSDIYVPKEAYENQLKRLRKALSDLDDKDRVDAKARDKDLKKWRDTLTSEVQKLESEFKKQIETQKRVMARLEKDKGNWLSSIGADYKTFSKSTPTALLQYCVLPRCIQSPEDALFCAKLIQLLHSIKTPRLSTLVFYNTILNNFGTLVFSRTENEARHLGKFVCELLTTLNGWAKAEDIFNRECYEFPGFNQVVGSKPDFLIYTKYQRLVRLWHQKLSAAFCQCLDSKEASEVHNALTILSELVGGPFPIYENLHSDVKARVFRLNVDTNHSHGNSITVMARSIYGRLTSCEGRMIKLVQKKQDQKKQDTRPEKIDHVPAAPRAVSQETSGQARKGDHVSAVGDAATDKVASVEKESLPGVAKASAIKAGKDSSAPGLAPEKRKEGSEDVGNGDRSAKRPRGNEEAERKDLDRKDAEKPRSTAVKVDADATHEKGNASKAARDDKSTDGAGRDATLREKEKEKRSSPSRVSAPLAAEKKEGKLDGNVESDAKKEMSAAQRDPKRARREDESLKTVAAQPDRANNANKGLSQGKQEDRSGAVPPSSQENDNARHSESRDGQGRQTDSRETRQPTSTTSSAKEKSRTVATSSERRSAAVGDDRVRAPADERDAPLSGRSSAAAGASGRQDSREPRQSGGADADRDRQGRGGTTAYSGASGRDGSGARSEREPRGGDDAPRGGARDGARGGGAAAASSNRDRSARPPASAGR